MRDASLASGVMVLAALGVACGDGDAHGDADTDGDAQSPCEFPWTRAQLDPFIDEVVDFSPADGASFGASEYPHVVLGPPHGAGAGAGSSDVLSLGCGGSITVRFDDPIIADGPGADFIVFENAFFTGESVFAEPARISVSVDGETFVPFPCEPETLVGCAGRGPVLSAPDNCLDPTVPDVAGGDAFDLADIGVTEATDVRLDDVSAENAGSATWCGGETSGFDLDAMAVVMGE
jgi:hypothetical protein